MSTERRMVLAAIGGMVCFSVAMVTGYLLEV